MGIKIITSPSQVAESLHKDGLFYINIGEMSGILHPEVLRNFDITNPSPDQYSGLISDQTVIETHEASAADFDIEQFLRDYS